MADNNRDVSILVKAIDMVTGPIRDMNAKIEGFVGGVKSLMGGLTAGLASLGLVEFFKSAADEAVKSESTITDLDSALKTLGGSYEAVKESIEPYLAKLQETTRFSDEDARQALTTLIVVTGDYQKSVDLLGVTADVAAKRHQSMADAADAVGKASIGLTKGVRDLGVQTTDATEAIKQLRENTTGFAEADGKTAGGRLVELNHLWGEFKEQIGFAIIGSDNLKGAMSGLATSLVDAAKWIAENKKEIGDFVDVVVTGIAILANGAKVVAGGVKAAWDALHVSLDDTSMAQDVLNQSLKTGVETVVKTETAKTAAVTWHSNRRVSATKDETAAQKKFQQEEEAAQKKADESLHEIDRLAYESGLDLLTEAHKKTLEVEAKYREKAADLEGEDAKKAQAAYQAYLDNRLLKLAGFTEKDATAWKSVDNHALYNQNVVGSSLENLSGKLDIYTQKTTGMTQADIDAWHAKADLNAQILAIIGSISDGAGFIGDMAKATEGLFGKDFTDQVGIATQAIQGMSDAASKLLTGDIAGGLVEGAGALVSLGKSIFGGDANLAKQLKHNAERLDVLSEGVTTLADIQAPGRSIAGVKSALGGVKLDFGKLEHMEPDVVDKFLTSMLRPALMAKGLSFTDLDSVAKAMGIDIRNDKGQLSGKLLKELLTALGEVNPGFANTFSSQRQRIQAGVDIGSITDELRAATDLVADPNFGIPAIAKALASSSTSGGKVNALQGLFANIGSLGAGDLGGATQSQFLDTLKWLIGLLSGNGGGTVGGPTVPEASVSANLAAAIGADTTATPAGSDFGTALNKSLSILTSIDANVAQIPPALTSMEASLNKIDASIHNIVNINGSNSDPNKIAAAIEDKLTSLHEAQIRAIDQALARRQQLAASALGKATRVAA